MYPDNTQQQSQPLPQEQIEPVQQPNPNIYPQNNSSVVPPTPVPNPNPLNKPPIPQAGGNRNDAIEKAEQITLFTYFGVAALLLFRFVLSLFGASRTTPFVDFIFQLTTPFMIPFESMFGGPKGYQNYQLEFEVLVALLVYGLVFFGLARLIKIIFK